MTRIVPALVLAFLAFLALQSSALAASIPVTTMRDEMSPGDGACSLREAITAVNAPALGGDCVTPGGGSNTIVLGPGRYALSLRGADEDGNATGDLDITPGVRDLTIAGAGPGATVIDASALGDRILDIGAGSSVAVSGVTLSGGRAPAGAPADIGVPPRDGEPGGGIRNLGTLTVEDARITDNRAGEGGAGFRESGGAGAAGGGIDNAGEVTVAHSTITGNAAGSGGTGGRDINGGRGGPGGSGGGIYNAGTVTLNASTLSGNFAGVGGDGGDRQNVVGGVGGAGGDGGSGGGVLDDFAATLSASESTFAGNFAGSGGTGGNGAAAGGNGGAGGSGGAVSVAQLAPATFAEVTISDNASGRGGAAGTASSGPPGGAGAAGKGGGVAVLGFCGAVCPQLQNSIVSANGGTNCVGPTVDHGHDLVFGDASCPGTNADPKLGPLQDHGGPTATFALLAGSPAIDAVPAAGAACGPADQRGVARPVGGGCDTGAYEYAPPVCPPVSATSTGGPVVIRLSCADPARAAVSYEIHDPPAHGTLSGLDAAAGTVTFTPAAGSDGPDQFTYDATGVNGTAATQTVSITVSRAQPGPGAGGGSAAGAPPRLSNVTLTYRRFRVSRTATAVTAARAPAGTTISFTLSAPAALRISIRRAAPGLARGRTCLAPTRALRRRHAHPCTRTIVVGALTRSLAIAGRSALAFSGRIGSRALAPGGYRAVLVARNAAGSSAPVAVAFTIVG
jgi:CSLREA domain-containing protein